MVSYDENIIAMFVARAPDVEMFPMKVVIILSLCMTVNTYSVVSLLAYVGVMVKDLLDLETTNKSGERLYHHCNQRHVLLFLSRVLTAG